ncbi:Dephospho-CoA kinase [compost metagenome]
MVSDIPLLFESGLEKGFDEVIVVYVPRSVQRERLMSRDGMTEEQADARINAQMDIEHKKQRADVVIDNSGLWSETEQQVISFLHHKGLI